MSDKYLPIIDINEEEEEKFIAPIVTTPKTQWADEPEPEEDKKYTKDELIFALRDTYDMYKDSQLSDEFVWNDAVKRLPVADLLEEAPGPMETLAYEFDNLQRSIDAGIPEVLTSFAEVLPDALVIDEIQSGPFEDWGLQGWQDFAAEKIQSYKDYKDFERRNNPRYAAWERWSQDNAGIDEWSDLASGNLLAKSVANWATTMFIMGASGTAGVVGSALTTPAGGAAIATGTALTLGGLFEGADEAVSSIEYLTKDIPVTNKQFNNALNEYKEDIVKSNNGKKLDPKTERAMIDNWIEGNYIIEPDGNILQKGLSINDAQALNNASVVGYTIVGGALEALPIGRVVKRMPGLEQSAKKWVKGGMKKKMIQKIRNKPFNPNVKDRIGDFATLGTLLGDGLAESVTEFMQYSAQQILASNQWTGYMEEGIGETWELSHALESAYMGFVGGFGMGGSQHLIFDTTGLRNRIHNLKKKLTNAENAQIFSHEKANGKFGVHVKNVEGMNENEFVALNSTEGTQGYFTGFGQTLQGVEIKEDYDTSGEALAAAEALDKQLHENFEKEMLKGNIDYKDATVEVKANDAGGFDVIHTSKDGKVLKVEKFDKKGQANRRKSQVNQGIQNVNRLSNKYEEYSNEIETENNNEQSRRVEDTNEIDADLVFLKGFMYETDNLSEKEQKIEENYSNNEKDTYGNPEVMINILKKKKEEGTLEEFLQQGEFTPQEIIENIENRVEVLDENDALYTNEILEEFKAILPFEETTPPTDTTDAPTVDAPAYDFDENQGIIMQEADKTGDRVIVEEPTVEVGEQVPLDIDTDDDSPRLRVKLGEKKAERKITIPENIEKTTFKERDVRIEELKAKDKLTKEEDIELKQLEAFDKQESDKIDKRDAEAQKLRDTIPPKDEIIEGETLGEKLDRYKRNEEQEKDIIKEIKKDRAKYGWLDNKKREDYSDEIKNMSVEDIRSALENPSVTEEQKKDLQKELEIRKTGKPRSDKSWAATLEDLNNFENALLGPSMPDSITLNIGGMDITIPFSQEFKNKYKENPQKALDDLVDWQDDNQSPKEKIRIMSLIDARAAKEQAVEMEEAYAEQAPEGFKNVRTAIEGLVERIVFPDGTKIKIEEDFTITGKGQYDPKTKTLYINPSKATLDTPYHEFAHPIIDFLMVNYPDVFEKLYNEIVESNYGPAIKKLVEKKGYTKPDSDKVAGFKLSSTKLEKLEKQKEELLNRPENLKYKEQYGVEIRPEDQAEFNKINEAMNVERLDIKENRRVYLEQQKITEEEYEQNLFKKLEQESLYKMEVIAEAIGLLITGEVAITKTSAKTNRFVAIIKRVLDWITSKFNLRKEELSTWQNMTIAKFVDLIKQKDYTFELENIQDLDINSINKSLMERIKYQLSEQRASRREVFRIFETIYKQSGRLARQRARQILKGSKDFNKWKRAKFDPIEFARVMTDVLENDTNGLLDLIPIFNEWFDIKFEKHLEKRILGNRGKEAWKNKQNYYIDNWELDGIVTHVVETEGQIREGLDFYSTAYDNATYSQEKLDFNDAVYINAFNMATPMTKREYMIYASGAINTDFYTWAEGMVQMLGIHSETKFENIPRSAQKIMKADYQKFNSIVTTNIANALNNKVNERDHYILNLDLSEGNAKIKVFELKGPYNEKGMSNPSQEKINLLEANVGKGIISLISDGDFKTLRVVGKRHDGSKIKEYLPRGNFLKNEEIHALDSYLLGKGLAIVGIRGDSAQMFLTEVKDEHLLYAEDYVQYWKAQLDLGLINKNAYDIYTGNLSSHPGVAKWNLTYDRKKNINELAADIAVHEAMLRIWPKYGQYKLNTVFKRLKIPTGQVTYSKELRNYDVAQYNPEDNDMNVSYVYKDGKPLSQHQYIEGVGEKNIADGATIVSSQFMLELIDEFGLNDGQSKLKTVVYHQDGNSTYAMKHEMFLADVGLKIVNNAGQKNEHVMAEILEDGTIMWYGKNKEEFKTMGAGRIVDMIATPDEVKIGDGDFNYKKNPVVNLPGTTMGIVKIDRKKVGYAKHGMQWYNHIFDEGIIRAFKDTIIPDIYKNLTKMFFISRGENPKDVKRKILKFLEHLKKTDAPGFMPDMYGLAELGAFRHGAISKMLASMVMNRLAMPALTADTRPGTRLDLSPNFRGDLNPGEIAVDIKYTKIIYNEYLKDHEGIKPDYNFSQKTIDKINKWLETKEINLFVTRFPVPHDGGAILARVKRVHNKTGVIEMHRDDTFARAEADHDGDHAQIEMLPPELETAIKNYFEGYKITGINLDRYVKTKQMTSFASKSDRYSTIDALGVGKRVVGSVSNVASVYGSLSQVLENININGTIYKLRKPNDMFRWGVEFKNNEGNWQSYVDITPKEYLRTILQAAVDNVEFMLINKWYPKGFDRLEMLRHLLVDEFGKSPSLKDMKAMEPIINTHTIPSMMRNGQGINDAGELYSLNLANLIDKSREYTFYTRDRLAYIQARVPQGFILIPKFKDNVINVPTKDHKMSYRMPAESNIWNVNTTTLLAVESGARTGTTRTYPLGQVGDIITFEGRPSKYRITSVVQLTEENTSLASQDSYEFMRDWIAAEGWTVEYFTEQLNNPNVSTVAIGSYQTRFEKIDETASTAPIEEMALQPYKAFKDGQAKYKGQRVTEMGDPYSINSLVLNNAHHDAYDFIYEEIGESLLRNILNKLNIPQDKRIDYLKQERESALDYVEELWNDWMAIQNLYRDREALINTDTNSEFIAFKEKYDAKYKGGTHNYTQQSKKELKAAKVKMEKTQHRNPNLKRSKNKTGVGFIEASNVGKGRKETAKNTPENITPLRKNEIFVFGSNQSGVHGKGAALTAKNKFGAIEGQGEGLQGKSYALPTKGFNIENLSLNEISQNIDTFFSFAKQNQDLVFYLTKIATGLGNKTTTEIADLIRSKQIPSNVILPVEFAPADALNADFNKLENIINNTEGTTTSRTNQKSVWFGPVPYQYTGAYHKAKTMHPYLETIARKMEQELGLPVGYYDSVLINLFEPIEGTALNPHRDNEGIFRLADNSIGSVGTLNLGANATIMIRDFNTKQTIEQFPVKNGDIYEFPAGDFQDKFEHAVGTVKGGKRISITFRRTNEAEKTQIEKTREIEVSKEYKGLSEAAKVIATIEFLNKYKQTNGKMSGFPAANKSKFEYQNLSETVLEPYFEAFENELEKRNQASFTKNKRAANNNIDFLLERTCK